MEEPDWRTIQTYIGLLIRAADTQSIEIVKMVADSLTALCEIYMDEDVKEYAE